MDAIYAFLTLKISSIEFRKCLLEDEELLERIAAKLPKSTFAHDPEWKDSPMCAEAFVYDDFDLRKTFATGYYGQVYPSPQHFAAPVSAGQYGANIFISGCMERAPYPACRHV